VGALPGLSRVTQTDLGHPAFRFDLAPGSLERARRRLYPARRMKGLRRIERDVLRSRRAGAALLSLAAAALVVGLALLVPAVAPAAHRPSAVAGRSRPPAGDGLGIRPGRIKHVWLIILENKSYDATFTGLNHNTYLWRTLPAQGVLLKNYYGTGHSSFDNYLSMVSGQATQPDSQADCPYFDWFSGSLIRSGSLRRNPNYGQFASAQGPNAAVGSNGCVYPAAVKTLFDQFDAAHVSWKGYAQDLDAPEPSGPVHSAGVQYCGAPYPQPGATGSTVQPNPPVASATNQYLPKHFPFPWFDSIRRAQDCNARHIADLFDPANGLAHDLRRASATPTFSWITPNMCSDGHDAVCFGNNLSGGFTPAGAPRPPRNYTGGLYAADLFLERVIPEIERSPAYKQGGLIDVTFDEAFPPFTFTGNSFANSKRVPPTAATSVANDTAAETLNGRAIHFEPTGPNTPLAKNSRGQELYPGPGDNAFIDRPSNCVVQTKPRQPAGTCLRGSAGTVPGPRVDSGATAPAGSSTISDNAAVITDVGRTVTGAGIPAAAFVGTVTNSAVTATQPVQNGGFAVAGSFAVVDRSGRPLQTTAPVSGVTLGARTPATDPLFDARSATNGGGDTGSVLISPFIRPGSTSTRFYNHYSWLRTIEDLFVVARASRGLDGRGHLGYAAQPGLAPFGTDVFDRPGGGATPRSRLGAPDARTLTASPGHPALATEGDAVSVAAWGGRVLATAVGPAVPTRLMGGRAQAVPCTFTVTLQGAAGSVPLSAAAFRIVDEFGHVHRPVVRALRERFVPSAVSRGRRVTLVLGAVLPVGGGSLTWAPSSSRLAVAWDFDVELN
jgi:Phosphoesterase family